MCMTLPSGSSFHKLNNLQNNSQEPVLAVFDF